VIIVKNLVFELVGIDIDTNERLMTKLRALEICAVTFCIAGKVFLRRFRIFFYQVKFRALIGCKIFREAEGDIPGFYWSRLLFGFLIRAFDSDL
jgi:hypothetical protein